MERKNIAGWSIRWDAKRAQEAYRDGFWVSETLADALLQAASQTPDRILIKEASTNLSARELHEQAAALARFMAAHYPVGSVISFMLPNWHEAAVVYMAATLAGMVANPILPSLRERELGFLLGDVKSRIIFIASEFRGHDYSQMLSQTTQALDAPPQTVVVRGEPGGHLAYDALIRNVAPSALPMLCPDAVRMIMYTSGTTGRPKGVMHSHNSMHALIRQIGQHWHVEKDDCFFVPSPISHIGGSIYAFECPLLLGTRAVLMDQWDADKAIEILIEERCTHFAGATPFLTQLLAAARRAGTRLPDLKLFVSGGASVPSSLIQDAQQYFERAVVTRVYGSTEVPVTTVGSTGATDLIHAANTDGKVGIADVKLSDTGELMARGAQMLVGYVRPEDEETAFDDQGYYLSGDLAKWIDGQYLEIIGRSKDLIIRHGENIAPKEVEDLLIDHPKVAEAAIVGLPDPRTGEQACAVIVPNSSARLTVSEIGEHLLARGIAKFKVPERVEHWESLPRNDAGKVLKHQIREKLLDGLS